MNRFLFILALLLSSALAFADKELVSTTGTQTLTHKTLTSPTITNPVITGTGGNIRTSFVNHAFTSGTDILLSGSASVIATGTMASGTGSYVGSFSLVRSGRTAGDWARVFVQLPASINPTFRVYDNSPVGTQLFEYECVSTSTGSADLFFVYTGTTWIRAGSNLVATTEAAAELLAWYKADALSLSDGDPVTSWTDSSGNGKHAVQATGTAQPTLQTNEVNSLPAVQFDGTGDFLAVATSLFSGVEPRTIFAVYRTTDSATRVNPVCGQFSDDTDGSWFMLQSRDLFATGNPYLAGFAADVGTGTPADATWHLATVVYDGTTTTVYLNGTETASDTPGLSTANTPFHVGGEGMGIGAPVDPAFFYGEIAEIKVYNQALGTTEREAQESALTTKYGL